MQARSILWARLDCPGHDACSLSQDALGWQISGMAVYAEAGSIARLQYEVALMRDWTTRTARITGKAGERDIDITLRRDEDGTWWQGDAALDAVKGCADVDLGFTPATNTNALRRLRLDVGDRADTTAAWLDTADWRVKPLLQSYHRVSANAYIYRSPDHGFEATLVTDTEGLILDYPGLWRSA